MVIVEMFKYIIIPLILFSFCCKAHSKEIVDLIIVNKGERELYLYKNGKELKKLTISLGFEPLGTKVKRGDGKTPEGLFFIEEKLSNSAFFLALKISYPNPWQIRRALELNYHPGGQIMIHGTPNVNYDKTYHNIDYDWTEGCIAISNKEMKDIWKKIKVGTPIIIRK